ncbi:MAG: hypothetical protein IKB07_02210 [Lachnospiraceae bacterium]|nr:hypothetical protein [Lachnospiraceae bacterium]
MEKSKLGISVSLFGALTFMSGYFGISVLVLVAGYILLREENASLRKNAVGTIVLYLAFAALSLCIGLLSNVISLFNFSNWMYEYAYTFYDIWNSFISCLNTLVNIAEKVIFGLLALFALLGKEVKIPVIDKFLEKHF